MEIRRGLFEEPFRDVFRGAHNSLVGGSSPSRTTEHLYATLQNELLTEDFFWGRLGYRRNSLAIIEETYLAEAFQIGSPSYNLRTS